MELDESAGRLYVSFASASLNNSAGFQRLIIHDLIDCDSPVEIVNRNLNTRDRRGTRMFLRLQNAMNEWDRNSELSIEVEYTESGKTLTDDTRFCPSGGTCCPGKILR